MECARTCVEQVLVPTLRPDDIVILDTLGSHKAPAIRQAIRAAGARLFFLPAYSPDLNPIEQVVAKLKHLLRKAAERSKQAVWRESAHCSTSSPHRNAKPTSETPESYA